MGMRSFVVVLTFLVGCSSNDDVSSGSPDAGGLPPDGGDVRADAGSDAASGGNEDAGSEPSSDADAASPSGCAQASAGLSATADPQAPVLDASTSMLQRVTSNDAFCKGQKASHPGFGDYGYLLNIAYADADGDAPDLSALSASPSPVRFGSAPDATIDQRFDPEHGWSTQGSGASGTFVLQLCLDQAYPAGTFTVAVDVADKAGHRSSAICITEPTGG